MYRVSVDLHIEWLLDEYECEDCGTSYAHGAIVTIDGHEVVTMIPSAHCYAGTSFDREEVYKAILSSLKCNITERYDK